MTNHMSIPTKFKTTPSLFIALALACFGLGPNARATDIESALPFGNTADGVGVLTSLTSGAWNSGYGFLRCMTRQRAVSIRPGYACPAKQQRVQWQHGLRTMALFSNTTADRNVGIGAQALVFNTVGEANTAVGTQTLFGNDTGSGTVPLASGHWRLTSLAIPVMPSVMVRFLTTTRPGITRSGLHRSRAT